MALTFAIGDVHGCLGHLDALLRRIEARAGGEPYRLVALGDYVDRGPDSAGVVARMRELQARAPERVVCLLGNHEDMLLAARADRRRDRIWLQNGGETTLDSYGVAAVDDIPADDIRWMAGCPRLFEDERRCFVHAGLNPAFARDAQRAHDLVWIRDEFLTSDHDFGRFVVHGHTPRIDGVPDVQRRRVNLDTAAVYGGRLTAGVFDDSQDGPLGYLQVPD